MRMPVRFVAALVLCTAASARAAEPVRIAVVGDSISKNRIAMGGKGWPLYLGKLLGEGYVVQTFSANGVTALRTPSLNVWGRREIVQAAAMKPHWVLIMLGTNMGKPGHKPLKDRYAGDTRALVAHFARLEPKPKIYLCTPIPVYQDNFGIDGEFVNTQITPLIRDLAKQDHLPLIETYAPLKDRQGITEDGIHPGVKGMQAIAAVVYEGLMGKPAPAEKVAALAKEWQAAEAARPAKEKSPSPPVAESKPPEKEPVATAAATVPQKPAADAPRVAVLTVEAVRDPKGDGPDGKGNTDDDTWGFWFGLAHQPDRFARLDLHTTTLSADQRQNGIVDRKARKGHQKKVQGPIAGKLPNPKDSEGWIFHSDWDGRFEGVWGDTKAGQVIMYPYVEKGSHCPVAVTYRVPLSGQYRLSGRVTDLEVQPQYVQHDGAAWRVEVARGGDKGQVIARGGPFGDGGGRPDSVEVKTDKFPAQAGQLIRLVIDPIRWWGSDMTKVELKVERVEE